MTLLHFTVSDMPWIYVINYYKTDIVKGMCIHVTYSLTTYTHLFIILYLFISNYSFISYEIIYVAT